MSGQNHANCQCQVTSFKVVSVYLMCVRAGYVESLLLTNSNTTKSVRSVSTTSVGRSAKDDVQQRSLVYTDGRPGTLRCVAVTLSASVRLDLHVGRRNVTGELQATRALTTAGRRGLRLVRYTVELVRHEFLPSVDDAGRRLTCSAYIRGEPANTTSARLVVRRRYLTES